MTEQKTVSVDELLAQRGTTHGEYTEHARCTQAILDAMMRERTWPSLPPIIRETVHMIAHKLGRIATGNPYVADHYDDIAGYARLVSQRVVDGVGLAPGHDFTIQFNLARDALSEQEPAPEDGDLWSDLAVYLDLPRSVAKEQGLAMMLSVIRDQQLSPAQRTMAADMAAALRTSDTAEARPAPRIELGPDKYPIFIDGTGTRVRIGDPVYINGRAEMGHLRAIKDHPDVAEPLLVEFHTGTVHAESIWAPLRGTVYARQARALQEPQERFVIRGLDGGPGGAAMTERRVPRYNEQLDPPMEVVVATSASAADPTPVPAEPLGPGTPEDGGHHASVAEAQESTAEAVVDETVPFSHEIRREQRELQWKEWSLLEGQLIGHGTMIGTLWQQLYLGPEAEGNHTERYLMIPSLQDEYAR